MTYLPACSPGLRRVRSHRPHRGMMTQLPRPRRSRRRERRRPGGGGTLVTRATWRRAPAPRRTATARTAPRSKRSSLRAGGTTRKIRPWSRSGGITCVGASRARRFVLEYRIVSCIDGCWQCLCPWRFLWSPMAFSMVSMCAADTEGQCILSIFIVEARACHSEPRQKGYLLEITSQPLPPSFPCNYIQPGWLFQQYFQ